MIICNYAKIGFELLTKFKKKQLFKKRDNKKSKKNGNHMIKLSENTKNQEGKRGG